MVSVGLSRIDWASPTIHLTGIKGSFFFAKVFAQTRVVDGRSSDGLIVFSPNGDAVLDVEVGRRDRRKLRRLALVSDGLSVVANAVVPRSYNTVFKVTGNQVMLGNRLYNPDTLVPTGIVAVDAYLGCDWLHGALTKTMARYACVFPYSRVLHQPELTILVADATTKHEIDKLVYSRSPQPQVSYDVLAGSDCRIVIRTAPDDSFRVQRATGLIFFQNDKIC